MDVSLGKSNSYERLLQLLRKRAFVVSDERFSFKAFIAILVIEGFNPRTIMKSFASLDLSLDSDTFSQSELDCVWRACEAFSGD
jgi:hypothetical protein